MRDLARRLQVLDDAHREVAALARLVHAQGEACRRAQPERRLARVWARVRAGAGVGARARVRGRPWIVGGEAPILALTFALEP